MRELDLSIPHKQEALGVVIYFFDNLRKFANFLLGILAGLALQPEWITYLGIALGVGLLAMAVLAYFQYKRFTFHIEGDELVINEGVFVRDRTTIPFERIQTVHLHQNFIQRIINLTGVKIDTAGSKAKELQIRALKKHHALQIQEVLQEKTIHDVKTVADKDKTVDSPQLEDSTQLLVKLNIGELLKVAITENHIRNGLLAAAFIFGYISQYDEFFEQYLTPVIERYLPEVEKTGFYAILALVIFFLIISILISTAKVFLKYFDLEASLSQKAFQVKAGLLKRNEYTIPLRKIQFMEWHTNFLRKIPGFETVKIYQGQSHDKSTQTVEIPACFSAQSERILSTLYPEREGNIAFSSYRADNSYIRYLMGIFGLIGAVITGFIHYQTGELMSWAIYAGYLVLVLPFVVKYVKSIKLSTNGELVIYDRGWLFPKKMVIKTYKIQSMKWRQTIFQRRRDIGHVTLYTAAGKRSVKFLPIKLVREMHNYLLYKVETYEGSWM